MEAILHFVSYLICRTPKISTLVIIPNDYHFFYHDIVGNFIVKLETNVQDKFLQNIKFNYCDKNGTSVFMFQYQQNSRTSWWLVEVPCWWNLDCFVTTLRISQY